jgi:hypothetical protein
MDAFLQTTVSGLISGSVISAIIGFLLYRRTKRIEEEIKHQFQEQLAIFKSQREWKEQSISELLGPLYMQFDRTKRASDRWDKKNLYLEANIIRDGNTVSRDLLLKKGHLIPPELLNHAGELMEHYDNWLEHFNRVRVDHEAGRDVRFVFTYDFPHKSEAAFRRAYKTVWESLYTAD